MTVDVGAFSHWFDLGFRTRRQTVLSSPYWRGIGFALPAAIAAQLARPDRQVVAYAAACGAEGVGVGNGDELHRVLKQKLGSSRRHPVLIDVRTTVPALPHLVGAH